MHPKAPYQCGYTLFMWLFFRLRELLSAAQRIQDGLPLPARTIAHWSHIMDRMASSSGVVQTIRRTSAAWNDNVERIITHVPGEHTDLLKGLMAARRMRIEGTTIGKSDRVLVGLRK